MIALSAVVGLFLLGLILLRARAGLAARPDNLGVQANGELRECPDSPNCLCSFETRATHSIEPIRYDMDDDEKAFDILMSTVQNMNGAELVEQQADYFHAEFTTPLMKFVDDVEFLQDHENRQFHVRSASRVGHSDLGANKARLEKIRAAFQAATQSINSTSDNE